MTEINRTLQRLSNDAFGETYADPLDPDFIIRFKNSHAKKNLNGVSTTNYVTEIIVNDVNPVTINGVHAQDSCSIRVRVSGAFESTDRKIQMVKALCTQLGVWVNENTLVGFNPVTVPYNKVTTP